MYSILFRRCDRLLFFKKEGSFFKSAVGPKYLIRDSSIVGSRVQCAFVRNHHVQRTKITTSEFTSRRDKFVNITRKNSPLGRSHFIIFVPSGIQQFMAKDVPYVFRQSSDFRYLSGFTEPDSLLVLHSVSENEYRSYLFRPEVDVGHELWHGKQISHDEARKMTGVNHVYGTNILEEFLVELLKEIRGSSYGVWCDPISSHWNSLKAIQHENQLVYFSALGEFLLHSGNLLGSAQKFIHECRLIKSPAEASLLKLASEISSEAFVSTISSVTAGMSERQISSILSHESIFGGADRLSFPPVCAGGNRANTIHYIKNDEVVLPGEMILVDCGCEVEGYCSDVARTFPVDQQFTKPQQILYEFVLDVQQTLIKTLKAHGNNYANFPSLDALYTDMLRLIGEKLVQNGIVKSHKSFSQIGQDFCCHHVSHYLGMDVHDVHTVSRTRVLEQGMVFTVEPGIYIAAEDDRVASEFRGIGIRIEDDVYLGPAGPEILTQNCPSTIEEILRLRSPFNSE